jgi:hypothetical protein
MDVTMSESMALWAEVPVTWYLVEVQVKVEMSTALGKGLDWFVSTALGKGLDWFVSTALFEGMDCFVMVEGMDCFV